MAAEQKSKQFAFISHSSEDIEDVRQIKRFLAAKGLTTWISSEDIPGGAYHAEEIPSAIENCDAFILVLSKNAQESLWVRNELDTAISEKKLILPIQIDNYKLTKSFQYCLKCAQIITAYRRYGDACVELARRLCLEWDIAYPEDTSLDEDASEILGLPFLNSLVCQRLTDDPANKALINDFHNGRNISLEYYLRYQAWENDRNRACTTYLIKNQNDQILMYFTLKCGVLYESLNVDELKRRLDQYERLVKIMDSTNRSDKEQAVLEQAEEYYHMHGEQLRQWLFSEGRRIMFDLNAIRFEQECTLNHNVALVSETYPAVELSQFSINDGAKDYWAEFMNKHHFSRSMGEVLFWRFIVPAICKVQDAVGCMYVYTYAANNDRDNSLTKYLQNRLNFQQPDNIGVSKPSYDWGCEFLCQKIDALKQRRRTYFEQFRSELE